MATIEIRHIRRIARGNGNSDREGIQVSGAINAARQNTYPAGSFQLNHLDSVVFSSLDAKRGMTGSVATPNGALRNSINLRPILTGSTGTRTTTLAGIGSFAGAGTAVSAYFVAEGY